MLSKWKVKGKFHGKGHIPGTVQDLPVATRLIELYLVADKAIQNNVPPNNLKLSFITYALKSDYAGKLSTHTHFEIVHKAFSGFLEILKTFKVASNKKCKLYLKCVIFINSYDFREPVHPHEDPLGSKAGEA